MRIVLRRGNKRVVRTFGKRVDTARLFKILSTLPNCVGCVFCQGTRQPRRNLKRAASPLFISLTHNMERCELCLGKTQFPYYCPHCCNRGFQTKKWVPPPSPPPVWRANQSKIPQCATCEALRQEALRDDQPQVQATRNGNQPSQEAGHDAGR